MSDNGTKKAVPLTKEEHLINFIKLFAAIEGAMEPFKEQRRDLRTDYSENSWLTKEEMRLGIRAYRLLKQDADMEQLTKYFNRLKKTVENFGSL